MNFKKYFLDYKKEIMAISEERLRELLEIEKLYKNLQRREEKKERNPEAVEEVKSKSKSKGKPWSLERRVKEAQKNAVKKDREIHKLGKSLIINFKDEKRKVVYRDGDYFVLARPRNASEKGVYFSIFHEVDKKTGKLSREVIESDDPIEGVDFLIAYEDNKQVQAKKVGDNLFKSPSGLYYQKKYTNPRDKKSFFASRIRVDDFDVRNFAARIDGTKGTIQFISTRLDLPLTNKNLIETDLFEVAQNLDKMKRLVPTLLDKRLLPEFPDFKTNEGNCSMLLRVINNGKSDYTRAGIPFSIPFDENKFTMRLNVIINKFSSSSIDLALREITVFFVQMGHGGCLPGDKHDFKDMKLNDKITLYNPYTGAKSEGSNNCFFRCFKREFKAKGLGIKNAHYNKIRKDYNLKPNCKIPYLIGIEMIKDLLGIKVGICNQSSEYFGDTKDCDITLFLINEHYLRFKSEKKLCPRCGAFWSKTHNDLSCEQRRLIKEVKKTDARVVIPSVLKHKDWIGYNEMDYTIHYDIESYRIEHGISVANAIGWMYRGKYEYAFGEGCIDSFLEKMQTKEYIEARFLNAFNGSGFDHLFLIRSAEKQRGISSIEPLRGVQGIISSHIGPLKTIDIKLHLEGSLDSCLTAFGCKIEKGKFDHKKNGANLDPVLKEKLLKYLQIDVRGLEELSNKVHLEYEKNFGASWVHTISTSQMAYNVWKNGLRKKTVELPNANLYKFFRKSIYGGRTQVHRKYFESKEWSVFKDLEVRDDVIVMTKEVFSKVCPHSVSDIIIMSKEEFDNVKGKKIKDMDEEEIVIIKDRLKVDKELDDIKDIKLIDGVINMTRQEFDCIKDYLQDLDVCSLYPFAMKERFPVGEAIDTLEYKEGKMGIYRCSYKPNKKLLIPVLPKHENLGLKWNLNDDEGVYSSVDIETARKYGYEIKVLNGVYWEDSEYLFKDYIDMTYARKSAAGKGTPAYQVAKLFMNGLYGKMLQKPKNEKTFYLTKHSDWDKIIPKYYIKLIDTETFNDTWIITGECKDPVILDKNITKPTQLGVFVLSYSRRIMMDYFDKLGALYEKEKGIYYTDTDSIQIHGSQLNFDLGKEIGMLSDDLSPSGCKSKIVQAVWVAPKMYMLKYLQLQKDGKTVLLISHKVGKGVKKVERKIPITDEQYLNMLNGDPLAIENKDVFNRIYLKVNSKQVAKGIDPFSIAIVNQKKIINKKAWDGRVFDESGNSVPIGYE